MSNDQMPAWRPTIRDVAKRAGVSKSLVSLVYSTPDSVGAERRQRVLGAAAELGYRPNHIARSLNGRRDDIVGILVADRRNPVLDAVVEAARQELERAGVLGLMTSAVRSRAGAREAELDVDIVSMVADLRPSRLQRTIAEAFVSRTRPIRPARTMGWIGHFGPVQNCRP